jgi:hypothetical protein
VSPRLHTHAKRELGFPPLQHTYLRDYRSAPICRDVFAVLCPVKISVTTLACMLLEDSSLVFAVRLGLKMSLSFFEPLSEYCVLKPSVYQTSPLTGGGVRVSVVRSLVNIVRWGEGCQLKVTNIPDTRCATNLASPSVTRSSGGRPVSAFIARVGVMRIALAIPKNSVFILLSIFFAHPPYSRATKQEIPR